MASMAASSPMAVWMMTSKDGRLECAFTNPGKIAGLLTDVLLLLTEKLDDTLANLALGELDIVLGVTVILHQGKEVIVGDVKLKGNGD